MNTNIYSIELFRYLATLTPELVDSILKQLWDQEDIANTGFLQKDATQRFFHRVYVYLTNKGVGFNSGEDELIQAWMNLAFSKKNSPQGLAWKTLRNSVVTLIMHAPLDYRKIENKDHEEKIQVLIFNRMKVNNLPNELLGGSADGYVVVEHDEKERKTNSIPNNSNPIFWPNFVYYLSDNTPLGNFKLSVYDKDWFGSKPIGTFTIEGSAIMKNFHKQHAHLVTMGGKLQLHDENVALLVNNQQKKPKIKVDILYQEWGGEKGFENDILPLNLFNKTFWAVVQKVKAVPEDASQVGLPTIKQASQWETESVSPKILIGVVELTVPPTPYVVDVLNKALCHIPKDEDKTYFTSRQDALNTMGYIVGQKLPTPPEGEWNQDDLTSDNTFNRVFFYGIGATRIHRKPEGTFYVDFDELLNYPVRDGFESYQGRAEFDKNAKVTRILFQDSIKERTKIVYPGDKKWEKAKFILRSTALASVTAYEHLVQSHFIWSNYPNHAASAHLSPDHPIRRLLQVHTYRSSWINRNGSRSLAPPGGILDRLLAFPHDTLVKYLEDAFMGFKFYTFPQFIESLGMKEVDGSIFPMAQDGMEYWDIVHKYVHDYIHTFYKSEDSLKSDQEVLDFWDQLNSTFPNGIPELSLPNLITVLTQTIHYVSSMHTQAGNTAPYARDPAFTQTAIPSDSLMGSPQIALTQAMLTVATTGKQPMMTENFSHLIPDKAKSVWNTFHKELLQLSEQINIRNKQRPWKFNSMNPEHLVTSVAV